MSHGQADDVKEQVRQATDIVDLVGSHLQLRRQGRGYLGLCPWHDDTRPSMQVNPERQTFRCFVCDIGGDVFSWVMRTEGLEFREALEFLAERAGIAITAPNRPAAAPGSPGDKKTLMAAAAWAEQQFCGCLAQDPAAEPARRYLADRGITQESVAQFRLGFAPDRWDWLLGKSRSTPFSPAVLERIGLVRARQGDDGRPGQGWYDFYRGRVIFPIRDLQARPIAFGGRILPELSDKGGGKYINSPETPLFSKSNQLYAFDRARDGVASEGRVVVTEGYTDVIMAHQHGVTNVVAVLGTALGAAHLRVIRRFTDSIVLVLDGDEAGQRRTNEVLELFVANEIDLRILGLPEGLDPCDFIATPKEGRGPNAFRELVRQAPDALEHKMQTVTNGLVTASDTHAASQAVEQVLSTLARIKTGVGLSTSQVMLREQNLLSRLARRFQLPEDGLRVRLAALRQGDQRPVASTPADAPAEASSTDAVLDRVAPHELELIELLLHDSATARRVLEVIPADEVGGALAAKVYSLCVACHDRHGEIEFHHLLDAAGDERLKNLLVQIDESAQQKSASDAERRLGDLVMAYQRVRNEAQNRSDLSSLRDERLDNQEKEEVLKQFFDKLKSRQTGPRSTEG